jgi:hypothetical protein
LASAEPGDHVDVGARTDEEVVRNVGEALANIPDLNL